MFSGEQYGKAEEAMGFYTSILKDSEILSIQRYGPGEIGKEGTVKVGRFTVNSAELMASDAPGDHGFSFTPSISLFVECESEAELDAAFGSLIDGGQALMPLAHYGFSSKFGWVQDKYGVSWQLNLA